MSIPTTLSGATHQSRDLLVARSVSGALIDLRDPDPAGIRVGDLAHGLAHLCRFAGNVTRWWSVADHALLCSELICEAGASELARAALHHDSHETLVGDIITPVRQLVGADQVQGLTRRLDGAIAAALGLPAESLWHPLVLEVDHAAARLEADALLRGETGHLLGLAPTLQFAPSSLHSPGPLLAARRFLAVDRRLRTHQQPRTGPRR